MNVLSCGLLWAKRIKHFGDCGRHFPPRDIRKNPRSKFACVPQAKAQFVLKIENLSHIMGPAPIIVELAIMAPGGIQISDLIATHQEVLGGENAFLTRSQNCLCRVHTRQGWQMFGIWGSMYFCDVCPVHHI